MEYELYHYGVKGMKWGVRKSEAERVASYTNREIGTITKRRMREVDRENRTITKREKRYDDVLSKYGQSPKSQKAANSYANAIFNKEYKQRIAQAEIEKLKDYKLSDVKKEQKAVGQAYAVSALATIGSATLATAIGAPFYMISVPDIKGVKTSQRIDNDTMESIYVQALKETNKYNIGRR